MATTVVEYKCVLISPSDVAAKREAIQAVVVHWNGHIGKALQARIELLLWEVHAVPESSGRPQASLNRQIVDTADFAVAVFSTRLGTPTGKDVSGSAEEIERLLDRGARLLTYFSSAPVPQTALKDDQFTRLQQYRKTCSSGPLWQFRQRRAP